MYRDHETLGLDVYRRYRERFGNEVVRVHGQRKEPYDSRLNTTVSYKRGYTCTDCLRDVIFDLTREKTYP